MEKTKTSFIRCLFCCNFRKKESMDKIFNEIICNSVNYSGEIIFKPYGGLCFDCAKVAHIIH